MGIRLVPLQRRRRASVTRIEADHRKTEIPQRMVEPRCKLPGFKPDPDELGRMTA
jgi:hypothetical protein